MSKPTTKVKELIALLLKVDGDLPICINDGPAEVTKVEADFGWNPISNKMDIPACYIEFVEASDHD